MTSTSSSSDAQPDRDIADTPVSPRKRAWSFYVVLFALVLPIWSTVPLSWLFVLYSLYTGHVWSYGIFSKSCFILCLAELYFSIYHFQLSRRVSGPSPCGPGDIYEIQAAFTRLLKAGLANLPEDGGDEESLDSARPGSPTEPIVQLEHTDPRAIDFRNSIRTWFRKAPWSSIKLLEMQKWLYWSMYNADLPNHDNLPQVHRQTLNDALELLQKRLGCRIPSGSDHSIQPMRLTVDSVHIWARPLTYYILIAVINRALKWHYHTKWRVHQRSMDGLEYLVRTPKNWLPGVGPRPLVFVHGLGLGVLQYHVLLSHLFQTLTDRPILVLLQPQISQDFFHPRFLKPMSRHETADRLAQVLHDLGWVNLDAYYDTTTESGESEEEKDVATRSIKRKKGVTMLSHSNGSYTHAWMLKGYPKLIARSCFVDPVTFCSWEGDVCYNFIYRIPMNGIELLMRYFVGSELGVANLLQRHFDWASNSLWYEEIPNARDPSKAFFLLGGKDSILQSARVKRYLTSHGIRKGLWYDPEGRHGQALMAGGPGHTEILKWLEDDQ